MERTFNGDAFLPETHTIMRIEHLNGVQLEAIAKKCKVNYPVEIFEPYIKMLTNTPKAVLYFSNGMMLTKTPRSSETQNYAKHAAYVTLGYYPGWDTSREESPSGLPALAIVSDQAGYFWAPPVEPEKKESKKLKKK